METGVVSNGRIAARVPKHMEFPDGMTIDAEGMLWIAPWGGGQIGLAILYDPIDTTTPQWQLKHYTEKTS